ncbi:uncharacterized protein LOC144166389 [Haemaphysalis longicornis]
MILKVLVSAFMVFALMISAVSSQKEDCDFHDDHLEKAIFEFIERLPAERQETPVNEGNGSDSLNLSGFKFVGLDHLRPFGPFFTFCRNGTKVVQFDLINVKPLKIVGSFSPKDGKTHEIESRALLVRLTSQFTVDGSGEQVKLHPVVNMPVSMVGLSLEVKGLDTDADEEVNTFLNLSKGGFLADLWHGTLFFELEKMFSELLPK